MNGNTLDIHDLMGFADEHYPRSNPVALDSIMRLEALGSGNEQPLELFPHVDKVC